MSGGMVLLVAGLVAVIVVTLTAVFLSIRLGRADQVELEIELDSSNHEHRRRNQTGLTASSGSASSRDGGQRIPDMPMGKRPRRAAPYARGFLAATTCLVPAGWRDRYLEEFHAELCDLADTGVGQWLQLHYVARQLIRAMSLNIALRAPKRRRVVP